MSSFGVGRPPLAQERSLDFVSGSHMLKQTPCIEDCWAAQLLWVCGTAEPGWVFSKRRRSCLNNEPDESMR